MAVYILDCRENKVLLNSNKDTSKWGKVVGTISKLSTFLQVKRDDIKTKIVIPNKKKYITYLEKKHFAEFEDYIVSDYYEKEIALVYGNCHTIVVSEVLNKCDTFTEKYKIYPIKPIHTIKSKDYFKHPVFKYCDLFIHQSIQVQNRYGAEYSSQEIIKLLPDYCKIISIPNVYHMPFFLFPQYVEKEELRFRGKTFFFRDEIIDEGYRARKTVQQIQREYLKNNRYSKEKIEQLYQTFIEKIKMRELDWDVKISNFIINSMGKEQLFYDINHPTNYLIKYICKEILLLLFQECDDEQMNRITAYTLDSYEMPIVPDVCNFIGVPFEDKEIRRNGKKVKIEKMFLKKYIMQYCSMQWAIRENNFILRLKSFILWIILNISDIPGKVIWVIKRIGIHYINYLKK